MISRREALAGIVGAVVGGNAATATANEERVAGRTVTLRAVEIEFRGGFAFLLRGTTSLTAMSPKKPQEECERWMDHPMLIVCPEDNADIAGPNVTKVDGHWSVELKGVCSITQGMPAGPLTPPQTAAAELESPYTPLPYDSQNGWNDLRWGIPLGDAPSNLDSLLAAKLTITAGKVDILMPPNLSGQVGRWKIPEWTGWNGKRPKNTRALSDRLMVTYSHEFDTFVIRTDSGDIVITPKQDSLRLRVCQAVNPTNDIFADGDKLEHARMLYSLAAADRCQQHDVPEYDAFGKRPKFTKESKRPKSTRERIEIMSPGDLCPFAVFDKQ